MQSFIDKLLRREKRSDKPICVYCGKQITDTAYLMISAAIVIDEKVQKPMIFTCPEQAFNYSQGYFAHSVCWIHDLRKKGVDLYDMTQVYSRYTKAIKAKVGDRHGMGKDKSCK